MGWVRSRRAARVVAINLFVAAVLSIALEAAVRAFHPEIVPLGTDSRLLVDSAFADVPGPRPGARGMANGAVFTVSPRGFWSYGRTFDSTRASWLFLGDSVTMGIGVAPDETFAGIVALLNRDLNVVNPSIMGYASDDYSKVLRYIQTSSTYRDLNLQRVTLFWCLNDIYGGSSPEGDPDQHLRRLAGPLLRFIHRNVFAYQWLKAVLFDRPRRYFEHDQRLYSEERLNAVTSHLQGIATLCKEYELRCEVVLLPYEYQLRNEGDRESNTPQHLISQRLRNIGLPVFDAGAYLREQSETSTELFLYGDGIHLSKKGHRVLAEYVMQL